jgi:hypothetical protein
MGRRLKLNVPQRRDKIHRRSFLFHKIILAQRGLNCGYRYPRVHAMHDKRPRKLDGRIHHV